MGKADTAVKNWRNDHYSDDHSAPLQMSPRITPPYGTHIPHSRFPILHV